MNQPLHGGNLLWAAALAGCSPVDIVDFSASINPLGPPQSAIAAILANLHSLSVYPNPDYYQLKMALSQAHQIPPDWILPGNGSAELLTWAGWELSKLELIYLITPAFGDYWRSLNVFNTKVQPYCLNWECSYGNLENFIKNLESPIPSNSGLLLNNPHNPTGYLFLRDEILQQLERFALVVVDEAFMDFLRPHQQQSLISMVQHYPNLVILRSLTKFYSLPGLRLGYAIAHPDRLRRWAKWRDPWPVNALASAAGVAVLEDTEFQQQTWQWLETTKPQMFEGLSNLPNLRPIPGAANFLLVESDQSMQIQEKLLKKYQILIRDCVSFPELGDRFFRVAVRSQTDNQLLLSALAEIA